MDRADFTDNKVNVTLQAMQELKDEDTQELSAEQETSNDNFMTSCEEAINPFAQLKKMDKTVKTRFAIVTKAAKSGDKAAKLEADKQMKDQAGQFERRNPELKSGVLLLLRERIKPGASKEEILKTLSEFYQDVSLADEALEFLMETTEGELTQTVKEAKDDFEALHGREITAGRNIGAQARAASEKGLGTPKSLRDLYRNITGNPRDSTTLFQELSQQYTFKDMKKVMDFLLHSLGADMKSKGPSIPHGQLHRLLTETRSLQAILGVYRFFRSRMGLVEKMFSKEGLQVPPQLNFETLAKTFMSLTGERYPTGEKAQQTMVRLGIDKWIQAKIIVLSQLRDAIREVAVNQIYRSIQHRDELFMAIIEALEDLEDELEELLEQQGYESEHDGKDDEDEEDEKGEKDELD